MNGNPHRIEMVDLAAQRQRIKTGIDAAIARVLEHGQFIMGPEVAELERLMADFTGARHVISCASGTDALLIAMMAKGVGPGDAVFCPAFTYTATPESVALLGATPVLVEVDERTFNVAADGLAGGLAAARERGLRPAGLIAVDLFGQPADYDAIGDFARDHGLWVLADAAQSFGGMWRGRPVGTLAEITATSFFPAKPLGCYGDGGALFTDDDGLADVMRSIRLHGKGATKYDVVRLGVNSRLDTIQAAILIEKLRIFPDELTARQAAADRYNQALGGLVEVPVVGNAVRSAWAQYTIRIPNGRRDAVLRHLAANGIPAQIYYPRSLDQQPAYAGAPVATGGVAVAGRLSAEVMSLPLHPYLSAADQGRIIACLEASL
jgi:dTDP-4-amino-4,6-dideoxygalactose transaminase